MAQPSLLEPSCYKADKLVDIIATSRRFSHDRLAKDCMTWQYIGLPNMSIMYNFGFGVCILLGPVSIYCYVLNIDRHGIVEEPTDSMDRYYGNLQHGHPVHRATDAAYCLGLIC